MSDNNKSRSTDSFVNRRAYLKSGAAVLTTGLAAGCAGGDDGGDDTTTEETTPADDQTTTAGGGTTTRDPDDISGTSIRIWCANGRHSQAAAQWFQDTAAQFEEETGANVSVNIPPSPYGSPQKWLSTFQNEDYPVLFEEGHYVMGHLLRDEWVHPLDDWLDMVDQDLWSNYEWLMPALEEAHRGTEVRSWGLPYDFLTYTPIVSRTDLLEEAGLSVQDDWPPQSWDEMVSMARSLQNDSSADFGAGIHGDPGDSMDSGINLWALSEGGLGEGTILNEDWSATNFDNDAWRDSIQKYIGLHREQGLASPRTPAHSDEDSVTEIATGTAGLGWIEILNYPVLQDQAGPLLDDGTIVFGETPSASGQYYNSPGMWCMTRKPSNVSASRWERKQRAAAQLVDYFLAESTQQNVYDNIGYLPGHEGVASDLANESREHSMYNAAYRMMQNSDVAYSVAEAQPDIMFVECSPILQQGLRGELTPSQVATQMAERGNELLSE